MTMSVSLSRQIDDVAREIATREADYPRQVGRGAMRQGEADYRIESMRGVQATLVFLQRNEQTIRAAIKAACSGDAR